MPKVTYNRTIKASVNDVWNFVSDINNWAPFMMGYQSHEVVNEKESLWRLKANISVITHTFEMRVNITEWVAPQKVGFELKGLTDPVRGGGLVSLAQNKYDATHTDVLLDLSLEGKGLASPIVNHVVSPLLEPMATELLEKIANEVEQVNA
jgi:carbon monoxide dehydrogenase subunit G